MRRSTSLTLLQAILNTLLPGQALALSLPLSARYAASGDDAAAISGSLQPRDSLFKRTPPVITPVQLIDAFDQDVFHLMDKAQTKNARKQWRESSETFASDGFKTAGTFYWGGENLLWTDNLSRSPTDGFSRRKSSGSLDFSPKGSGSSGSFKDLMIEKEVKTLPMYFESQDAGYDYIISYWVIGRAPESHNPEDPRPTPIEMRILTLGPAKPTKAKSSSGEASGGAPLPSSSFELKQIGRKLTENWGTGPKIGSQFSTTGSSYFRIPGPAPIYLNEDPPASSASASASAPQQEQAWPDNAVKLLIWSEFDILSSEVVVLQVYRRNQREWLKRTKSMQSMGSGSLSPSSSDEGRI
ncbi:MAG: hypothetical protein M1825_003739 [Sarcosagium campestre]|nr:MAG: hypothetical protein M1825_003739 [Sarcosagium campestre]